MRLAIVEDEKNFADNILGYLQRDVYKRQVIHTTR